MAVVRMGRRAFVAALAGLGLALGGARPAEAKPGVLILRVRPPKGRG